MALWQKLLSLCFFYKINCVYLELHGHSIAAIWLSTTRVWPGWMLTVRANICFTTYISV